MMSFWDFGACVGIFEIETESGKCMYPQCKTMITNDEMCGFTSLRFDVRQYYTTNGPQRGYLPLGPQWDSWLSFQKIQQEVGQDQFVISPSSERKLAFNAIFTQSTNIERQKLTAKEWSDDANSPLTEQLDTDELSWKCRRHVVTCRRRHNVSLQFWPNGSVSPTQNLRCRGSLCRLLPTFPRFSEVYNILRTFVPGPKHPLANKLFDIFGAQAAALKLKEIQQSKRVDDDGGGCVGGGRRRRSHDLLSFDVVIRHQCRHRHPPPSSAVHCLIVVLFVVVVVAIVPSSLLLVVPLLPLSLLLLMSPSPSLTSIVVIVVGFPPMPPFKFDCCIHHHPLRRHRHRSRCRQAAANVAQFRCRHRR
jgi:hypothetical protein